MATKNILQKRLLQAQEALHALMIGEREVSVTVSDYGATTFSQASRKDLEKYISDLETKIARLDGRGGRRPMVVRF